MPIPLEVVTMVTVFLRDRTTLFSVGDFERTLRGKEELVMADPEGGGALWLTRFGGQRCACG